MAAEPVPNLPAPAPPVPDSPSWPTPPVREIDWFLQMPNGGATVYVRPTD
jgi:hypothetical protein